MSRETDHRLADFAKWFHYHKNTLPADDIHKRMEFLEKTIDNLCLLQTYLVEDIQHLEGRRNLIIPQGVKVNGDLRRLG